MSIVLIMAPNNHVSLRPCVSIINLSLHPSRDGVISLPFEFDLATCSDQQNTAEVIRMAFVDET